VQKFKIFSKLALFGLFLCPLYGQDFYVNKAGSDANSCATASSSTDASAKLTIQAGINCLTEDAVEVLEVGAGTYDEEILRGDWVNGDNSWATATTIQGESGQTVILKPDTAGGDEHALEFDGNWVIWDNIDLDCTNQSNQCVAIRSINSVQAHHFRIKNSDICCASNNGLGFSQDTPVPGVVEIIDNTFTNNGDVGSCQEHGIYLSVSDGLVEGNTVSGSGGSGIQQFLTAGGVDDNIIRENIVHNNTCRGIDIGSGDRNAAYNNVVYDNGQEGIRVAFKSPENSLVYNNTIFSNANNCIRVGSGSTSTLIKNNICWDNSSDQISDAGTSTVSSNNLFSDPLFVDEAGKDFNLTSGSQAVDAGVTLSEFTSDILGTVVRSDEGTAWDIGAYELDQTPPTPVASCTVGAIVATELIALTTDSVDRSTYTTVSVSPSDDALQIFIIGSEDSDTVPPDIPVISGFTTVATTVLSTSRRLTMLRRLEASATSGTLAITFATDPQDWIHWEMYELSNVDKGGTNGADAVVQSDSALPASAETCSVTLNAFGSTNNATVGSVKTTSTRTFVAGSGFM